MNEVQKIIKEICEEKDINFKLVSKDWVSMLEKNGTTKYIVGYKFPLNDQAVSKVCDDKYALYEVMKEYNIPMTEHYIVFKGYDKQEVEEYCKKYDFNMVVQNNVGTCGRDMYHVESRLELFTRLDELLEKEHSINVSPYYNIKTEYRIVILKGNAELIYGKKKPIVYGNGKKTKYELLCEFNLKYFSNLDNISELKEVLPEGEKYEYNWQFNLSKGSIPFFEEDSKKLENLKDMAKNIADKLGINFASVDLMELEDGSLLLLEVNSGVMMKHLINNFENGRLIAKRLYTKVIDEMFK